MAPLIEVDSGLIPVAEEDIPISMRASKRQRVISPIETANGKSDDDFINDYLRPSPGWTEWAHPAAGDTYKLSLVQAGDLSREDMDACFALIDETSGPDYRSSSVGWQPSAKRKEMRSPDLRYILVRDEAGDLKGFTSMMPTFENHEPVVYCYEIHLRPDLQGSGLGKQLMRYVMDVAEAIPSVEKTMLTCFMNNTQGRKFYEKMGFVKDPYSPAERRLRGGKVVAPDYVILSRETARARGDGDPAAAV